MITDQGVVMLVNGSTVTTKEEIVISTSDEISSRLRRWLIIAGNTVKPIGQEPDQESNQGEDIETKPLCHAIEQEEAKPTSIHS